MLRVWDPAVRLLHWTLALAVAVAWLSTLWFGGLHQGAGWVALAAVALRLAWGSFGGGHARFAGFLRGPRATWAYARQLLRHAEPRYIGHNPLGGWMILALLACVAGLALTGWLYTTDALWGDAMVEAVHVTLAWALLALVALHVAGVLFTSARQRENLVAAMFSGRKRDAGPGDVP